MKNSDLGSSAAKLEGVMKTFRTTLLGVEPQWDDAARRRFEEEHLATMEPRVRNMVEAITRLADVISSAERQCSEEYT